MDERSLQTITRPCLTFFAENIKRLPEELFYEIANSTITLIKNTSINYDEADNTLRESVFEYLVKQRMFSAAGQILSGLNLDSTQKIYTESQKVDIYIRCAETFLEDGEGNEAEIFLNRASPLMHSISDWTLQLRYSVTLARVLDSNRKFVDAAMRYYDLSMTQNKQIVQDDLLELYGKAITCAILGKAGPLRVRIMSLLFKDERKDQLDKILVNYSTHGAILTKMYNNEIVHPNDMKIFENSLMDHQKAISSDGFTLSQKAVIEHNLFAAKRIYDNILFSELSLLLGLDINTTELIATKMITEERLKGIINQDEGVLYFLDSEDETTLWDNSIKDTCNRLNTTVELIEQLTIS